MPSLKKSFSVSFSYLFYRKFSDLSIFLKSSNIVITGRPEICGFQLFNICYIGRGWIQVFWLSKFTKYLIYSSLLKRLMMFTKHLRIVEDVFYFSGIILLTCPKKVTLGLKIFTVNCLIFILLSSTYRYVKYIEQNHCISPFSIFNHCFINLALQYFPWFFSFLYKYVNKSLFKIRKRFLEWPYERYLFEFEQVIARSTKFAACCYMLISLVTSGKWDKLVICLTPPNNWQRWGKWWWNFCKYVFITLIVYFNGHSWKLNTLCNILQLYWTYSYFFQKK